MPTSSARGFWGLRDRPAVAWLFLAAAVAVGRPWVPKATWLMVHLVLLGALTHAAMVWSTHFSAALLKTRPELDDRRRQSQRLLLLLVGVALVVVGVPWELWPVTVTGATAVAAAVVWHGIQLGRRLRAALPGRFRITIRYYLVATAAVPIGATYGAILARELDDELTGRLIVAHTAVMGLGWLGLILTGTLVTLWPTMLRTRMDQRAEHFARQALPWFVAAVIVVATGATLGSRLATVTGLAMYVAALLWWGRAMVLPARTAPPRHFSSRSVSVALGWLVICLVMLAVLVLQAPAWEDVDHGYQPFATALAVGFAAQLLIGALSYLVPSVLGGGPSVVRTGLAWLDRWSTARLVAANLGLLLVLLPVPDPVKVVGGVLVGAAVLTFVPLMGAGIRAAVTAREDLLTEVAQRPADG